jgi:hypothetical protein
MFARARFRRSLLVLCCLFPGAWGTMSAGERDVPGIYQGHAPEADAAKRVFTLKLASDGTALLTTVFIGKGDATERGRWSRSGSQIVITFDAMGPNRPPHPLTFHHRGRELSPVHWDPSEWGRHGPPVLHWARDVQGG